MANPVQDIYLENLKTMSAKDAAKDAQKRTGLALRTGKPPKRTTPSLKSLGTVPRQFPRKLT
jgi:hypothetical protein